MVFSVLVSTVASLVCASALSIEFPDSTSQPEPRRAQAQYFLWSAEASEGQTGGEPIAAIALRTIRGEGADALSPDRADFLFELDVVFKRGGMRIRHTESGRGAARRLVWRESLPKASRTWISDWDAVQGPRSARVLSYGWHRPIHDVPVLAAEATLPVFGPLESLARFQGGAEVRQGVAGRIAVVDPLAASIVAVAVESSETSATDRMELRRGDGTLLLGAARSTASPAAEPTAEVGEALGLSALFMSGRRGSCRRIERAEFERLERRWAVPTRRPYEAMLEAIVPRR
ncbi:MAG: hypothetical protein AAGG01_07830 [Planctomycetota bacterium]